MNFRKNVVVLFVSSFAAFAITIMFWKFVSRVASKILSQRANKLITVFKQQLAQLFPKEWTCEMTGHLCKTIRRQEAACGELMASHLFSDSRSCSVFLQLRINGGINCVYLYKSIHTVTWKGLGHGCCLLFLTGVLK